jgi:hypothetical protein
LKRTCEVDLYEIDYIGRFIVQICQICRFLICKKKLTKKSQKVGVHNLAENGTFFQILLHTWSCMSLDPMWCILDHYIIFMNCGSISNSGEKIENFSQVKFHRNFLTVNFLGKIQTCFFMKFKIWCFFFLKNKTLISFTPFTPYVGSLKKCQIDKKLWKFEKQNWNVFKFLIEKLPFLFVKKMCRNFCQTIKIIQKVFQSMCNSRRKIFS